MENNKDNKDNMVNEKQENNNIKEVENLDVNTNKTKKSSKFFISFFSWKYIYYIFLIAFSLIVRSNLEPISVTLGDIGSIIPVLLSVVSTNGLKWIPLFSIIGIILIVFEAKFKEISKVYLVVTGFVTVASILIQFII